MRNDVFDIGLLALESPVNVGALLPLTCDFYVHRNNGRCKVASTRKIGIRMSDFSRYRDKSLHITMRQDTPAFSFAYPDGIAPGITSTKTSSTCRGSLLV